MIIQKTEFKRISTIKILSRPNLHSPALNLINLMAEQPIPYSPLVSTYSSLSSLASRFAPRLRLELWFVGLSSWFVRDWPSFAIIELENINLWKQKVAKMLFLIEMEDPWRLENVVGLLEKLRNDNPDGRIQKDWKILPSHSLRSWVGSIFQSFWILPSGLVQFHDKLKRMNILQLILSYTGNYHIQNLLSIVTNCITEHNK